MDYRGTYSDDDGLTSSHLDICSPVSCRLVHCHILLGLSSTVPVGAIGMGSIWYHVDLLIVDVDWCVG